ncbi:FAD-binding oxidoreductase [Yersinia aldovae]|uniref:FAD-binding oxidoreductase n=1 Tax=Yersinia aldovae TaxID=29483 RepID=UPI001AD7F8BF|nr:FAD-binding oxidoreductase [Yersinia aldovae]
MIMNKHDTLEQLRKMMKADQVIVEHDKLYDAAADRYKKYAKAKEQLNVPLPTAIVLPESASEVAELLKFCNENAINVIPRSGKTATEGGLENWKENTLVIDSARLNKIVKIDKYNMEATVQAGVCLQTLEDEVRKQGLTTGHSPQSKPVAQYGGLVATRSIGQFSTLYGGIEDMVLGLECVFPNGHISRIKSVARRAGGPDIRHVVIGNEGSLCFITEVTVKLFTFYPENNRFIGHLIKDVASGIKILRDVMAAGYRPSVARVYSEEDAAQHFSAFHEGKCVLIFMVEGPRGIVKATIDGINAIIEQHAIGILKPVESQLIEDWFNHLNWSQARIEQEVSDMVNHSRHDGFTTEISASWEMIPKIYDRVIQRIRSEFARSEDLTMLGGHSSHSYINGTNMYFVYNYNINCEPKDEMRIYHHPIQRIIVEETLKLGGSMCHHHGIGKYRNEWTKEEHGSAYYILQSLKEKFDPQGIMNFGCIYPQPGTEHFFE